MVTLVIVEVTGQPLILACRKLAPLRSNASTPLPDSLSASDGVVNAQTAVCAPTAR